MFFGGIIFFNNEINLIFSPLREINGEPGKRMVLDTMIFHLFVLMNLFNQINCRVLDPNEINIFRSLFNNVYFWIVLIAEVFIQQLLINAASSRLGSALIGTAPLTYNKQLICWILGSLSLVVNVISKYIPEDLIKFSDYFDIETENRNDKFNRIFEYA